MLNPNEASGDVQLLALVDEIYASVTEPELWPSILDHFARAVGGRQTFLFAISSDPTAAQAIIGSQTDPDSLRQLQAYYHSVNVFSQPADAAFRDGQVRYGHRVLSDEILEKSEFYNDFFRPFGMHHSFGLRVPTGCEDRLYLSSQRPKGAPAFGDREGAILQAVMPHIVRAFGMRQQLAAAEGRLSTLNSVLDSMHCGVLELNVEGHVVHVSTVAKQLMLGTDCLRMRRGILVCRNAACQQRLRLLVQQASTARTVCGVFTEGDMLLRCERTRRSFRLTVRPLSTPVGKGTSQVVAVGVLAELTRKPQWDEGLWRTLFGLTPAESAVAHLLLTGFTLREVAEKRAVAEATVRHQVKSLFSKTGTRRQADLVRTLALLTG